MSAKEKFVNTILKYSLRYYVRPHPWDDFLKKQLGYENNSKFIREYPAISLRNPLGEVIQIFPPLVSRYDWVTKYITSACGTCPFFIAGRDQLEPFRYFWNTLKKPNVYEPEDHLGVCLYSQTITGKNIIPKFLVPNTNRPTLNGCTISSTDRATRYEQRKAS